LIEVEAGKIILDVFRNFPLAVGFSFVRNFIERFFFVSHHKGIDLRIFYKTSLLYSKVQGFIDK
jgi:hypothetical protein